MNKEQFEARHPFAGEKKPSMKRRCVGQLLLLAPWEHHNERILISRRQCLSLNDMAARICVM